MYGSRCQSLCCSRSLSLPGYIDNCCSIGVLSQAREHATAAVDGEEVVRYDSETIIAPRSVSPSRRRNTSRWHALMCPCEWLLQGSDFSQGSSILPLLRSYPLSGGPMQPSSRPPGNSFAPPDGKLNDVLLHGEAVWHRQMASTLQMARLQQHTCLGACC